MTFDIFELLASVFLTAVAAYGIGFGRGYEEAQDMLSNLHWDEWQAARPWNQHKEPK